MKTEYVLLGAVGVAAIAMVAMKKKDPEPTYDVPADNNQLPVGGTTPSAGTTPVSSPSAPKLNNNLVLKKGVNGLETKELQRLLGISADGIFGAQTESALVAKKGVKQITLATYNSSPNVNTAPLSIGTKVMANKKPSAQLFKNKTLADGSYSRINEVHDTVDFGDAIGQIVAISQPSKTQYVVSYKGLISSTLVWVAAADVKKI